MRFFKSILATLLAATWLVVIPPVAHADPFDCTGYPEPRIMLESQGWWITENGQTGTDNGHLHQKTCFPVMQTFDASSTATGIIHFDLIITMHAHAHCLANPTTCYVEHTQSFVEPNSNNNLGIDGSPDQIYPKPGQTCGQVVCPPGVTGPLYIDANGVCGDNGVHPFELGVPDLATCVFPPVGIDVDITGYAYNGRASIRFRTERYEPADGKGSHARLRTSNDWQIGITNNDCGGALCPTLDFKNNGATTFQYIESKGWYTQGGYSTAAIWTGWPFAGTSGLQTIVFTCAGSQPTTECLVTVDPDFHAGNSGTILYQQVTSGKKATLVIDLSQFAPGTHYLFIRSKTVVDPTAKCLPPATSCPSTKAGVLKVPFTVT